MAKIAIEVCFNNKNQSKKTKIQNTFFFKNAPRLPLCTSGTQKIEIKQKSKQKLKYKDEIKKTHPAQLSGGSL